MAGVGDIAEMMKDSMSDMPDKIKGAGAGIKDLFTNFGDLVKK